MSARARRRASALATAIDHAYTDAHGLFGALSGDLAFTDLAEVGRRATALADALSRLQNPRDDLLDEHDEVLVGLVGTLFGVLETAQYLARGLGVRLDAEDVLPGDVRVAREFAARLLVALRHAFGAARALQRAAGRSGRSSRQFTAEAWSARKLVGIATRLVQVDHRARYAEEFRGELRELAEADAGRTRQIGYAINLLVRSPALRVELRSARRRSASP